MDGILKDYVGKEVVVRKTHCMDPNFSVRGILQQANGWYFVDQGDWNIMFQTRAIKGITLFATSDGIVPSIALH